MVGTEDKEVEELNDIRAHHVERDGGVVVEVLTLWFVAVGAFYVALAPPSRRTDVNVLIGFYQA
jgi:hypothetical protein